MCPSRAVESQRGDETTPLLERFRDVRAFSEHLCQTLETEDFVIQSMDDVSPTKWHLAHTSWFFETFILRTYDPSYVPINEDYNFLFNSYYVRVGERHFRPHRGLLARPTVKDVFEYRAHVDAAMSALLETAPPELSATIDPIIEIGLHHEQQHQELLVTDIKHVFSMNPLLPAFRPRDDIRQATSIPAMGWVDIDAGIHEIGHDTSGFAYDNESPRHRVFIEPAQIGNRLITNGEYREFIADGAYRDPRLWLSEGWATVEREGWDAPLYWSRNADEPNADWNMFTLSGSRLVDDAEPVCHVSFFEAEAFARWSGCRLATEFEWEAAIADQPIDGNFVAAGMLHPVPLQESKHLIKQAFGDVWEWTLSHYSPYPGYVAPDSALGEYNGKFMCGQFVLRGGSCATTQNHVRKTYRNFFPPDARWQFSGIRLARGSNAG
jgi:ergothioneine biosynthesis protein EgtB